MPHLIGVARNVINLRTAATLRLTVPPSIMSQATEVIQ